MVALIQTRSQKQWRKAQEGATRLYLRAICWSPEGRGHVASAEVRPTDGLAVDFVVKCDHVQFSEIVQPVRVGRLRANHRSISAFDDAVATFSRIPADGGRTVICGDRGSLEAGSFDGPP